MVTVSLSSVNDFEAWRQAARGLLRAGVRPQEVIWADPAQPADLFDNQAWSPSVPATQTPAGVVSPKFIELARTAICHADPERFGLLYRLLWRLQKDRNLLSVLSDVDVAQLARRVSAVRRDAHKMTAFVRFRTIADADGQERFAAWFEPDHYILERTAPFFCRRFDGMEWAIVTPYRSAFWDKSVLRFGPGGNKADVPSEDAMEAAWKTYYASIFNPARLKVAMMQSEMPKKYWRNLPEAELIAPLISGAKQAEQEMIQRQASQPPARHMRQEARREPVAETAEIASLQEAREAIHGCRRCPLYEHATQAVFGEGPKDATIMVVGEQPGDQEDLAGRPFVGPAGQVFDAAIEAAGIDRRSVYVTNAVKHFKFEPRGKRRIHQKPSSGEITACRFWLDLERREVKPRIVVAMGATAAQAVLGRTVTISKTRGEPIALEDGSTLFVTVHPSYLLRLPDRELAAVERERFVADLARVRIAEAALKKQA